MQEQETYFLETEPPVAIHIRRSARARRITLRVSSVDGRVSLTLPQGVKDTEAMAFAHEKRAWVQRHLDKQGTTTIIKSGAEIPIEGHFFRIEHAAKGPIKKGDHVLYVSGASTHMGRKLAAWFKTQARNKLVMTSDHYAAKLGRPYSKITLRDTRSRWGSCSADGALMYSWRLMMAPRDVLDYVAAHEVAHLEEMNHSTAFWNLVEHLKPGHGTARAWLRKNGHSLHRYRFEN